MTEMEFIKLAKEFGYFDDEIQDFLDFQKEAMLPFDMIPLIEHTVHHAAEHTVN